MNRDEKATAIEEIAADIEAADAIFAVDYRGISVPQAAELRAKLRESDASFRIVKNRLTKIAADKAGAGERLNALLQGPTALTFVRGDTAQAAKAISTFNKEHKVLTFKGGFMDGIDVDESGFEAIAKLPSRDVLNGQLAGVVASPLTGLVRGLGSMIQGLALQLGQIAEKGLVTGEAPAEPAPAEEAPATEAPAEAEEAPAADPEGEAPATEDESPKDEAPAAEIEAEEPVAEEAPSPEVEEPAAEAKAEEAEPAAEAEQAEDKAEDDDAEDETSNTDDDDASKEEE
jgi:large subunit ribosomal protein L10